MAAPLKTRNLAALLLLVAAVRHFGWGLVPVEMMGAAFKAGGGLAIITLIAVVFLSCKRSWPLSAVLAWWAYEEAQVTLCGLAWMVEPWPVPPGQAICSARAGVDFGALSLLVVAALALAVNSYSTRNLQGMHNGRQ